ncbi:cuticle protein 21-like [Agrilus planipennis]|uniref:Cuticle protein 21-like n=1 Tax=Agrilus planipennis TaxID=224129 RepID=A0A1W4WSA7_AGRPL|nr:cuticle protein 21-like [Agrilus planipennis]
MVLITVHHYVPVMNIVTQIILFAYVWTVATAGVQQAPAVSYSYISHPSDHVQHYVPQVIKKTVSPFLYTAPVERPSYVSHSPTIIHHQSPTYQIHKIQEPALIPKVAFPTIYTQPVHVPTIRKEIRVAPVQLPPIHRTIQIENEQDVPAHYEFGYSVEDHHTGDIKKQQEIRNGHVVQGSYSLIDPDGFKRVVQYAADDHKGFTAVVHREPIGKVITKVAAPPSAPTLVKVPLYRDFY